MKLPAGWNEFTQKELRETLKLMSRLDTHTVVPVAVFRMLSGMRVMAGKGDSWVLRFGRRWVTVSSSALAELLTPLEFMEEPGNIPAPLDKIAGRKRVDAGLHGVSFGNWLRLENAWQGFLMSHRPELLRFMLDILYPAPRGLKGLVARLRLRIRPLREWEILGMLQWISQLKGMFAGLFPHFFQPAGSGSGTPGNMIESMNNQLRALTGGDLSKEDRIRESDCWRALTELDYKAKEAEDMKKKNR